MNWQDASKPFFFIINRHKWYYTWKWFHFQESIQESVLSQDINEDDIVVVRKLRKSYKLQDGREVGVLRNITLDRSVESFPIRRGEFLIIRGPSGSGKTRYEWMNCFTISLLNIIGTIDKPTSGSVYLFGKEVKYHEKEDNLAKLRLHHVIKNGNIQ